MELTKLPHHNKQHAVYLVRLNNYDYSVIIIIALCMFFFTDRIL